MITPSKNTIKTNAKFAQEVYKWFLNRKHGIGSCCGVELDRYYTKKENCDLGNRILDGYCMPEPVIPVPPVCPVECVEGSYATAYFNLLSLVLPADPTAPSSGITLSIPSVFSFSYTIDRNITFSFSDPDDLQDFISLVNDYFISILFPFTLSFAATIPGAMGYGLVLTSNDKTNIYNDLVLNINIGVFGGNVVFDYFNLDSPITGGVISTC